MANADGELDEQLDMVLTVVHSLVNTGDLKNNLKYLFRSREAALLDRIKEEGPKNKTVKDPITRAFLLSKTEKSLDEYAWVENEINKRWHATIDNIAKEIRGEK